MGMSPTVYCLWQRLLRFDPDDPIWMNRDRLVLSAGHGDMRAPDVQASATCVISTNEEEGFVKSIEEIVLNGRAATAWEHEETSHAPCE